MAESSDRSNGNHYQQRIIDLSVNGHLMSLDTGLYCIYHAANQIPADEFGFPGLRISLPPFKQKALVEIKSFETDGWLGAEKNAVLIRVSGEAGLVLVTVYQNPMNNHVAPQLQVLRLNDAPDVEAQDYFEESSKKQLIQLKEKIQKQSQYAAMKQQEEIAKENKMQVVAHVQRLGDVTVELGDWIGIPDSKTWIEGFGLVLDDRIQPEDIEYQAVLGKGWFSPWYKGNEFCGSRGMSLPLCGLRVRLNGEAAKKYAIDLTAMFIDGTKLGPVSDDTVLSSEAIAPLEAFRFNLVDIKENKDEKKRNTSTSSHASRSAPGNIKLSQLKTNIETTRSGNKTTSSTSKHKGSSKKD